MSKTVLKVENISKQYRLGFVGTGTLSHDLSRWWANIRGKEDEYLKVGEVNDRTKYSKSKYVWGLKDINFEVKQGEVVGIIGKNGSGKSTLLKILSRVTGPTTGSVKCKGKVSSLLEVGTGFHPELTGKENIFLSGAILGMKKQEIQRKMDEIIAFAEVERYIDTPVKRYSSGMYVRLAFAVAAHLQTDIILIDEVLSVGDDSFRKKCLNKMQNMTKSGQTILFVSHNMPALQLLCRRGILLNNGGLVMDDDMRKVANVYLNNEGTENKRIKNIKTKNDGLLISYFSLEVEKPGVNQPIHFNLSLSVINDKLLKLLKDGLALIDLYIDIHNSIGSRLISLRHMGVRIQQSESLIKVTLENSNLPKGNYSVSLNLNSVIGHLFYSSNILNFSILSLDGIDSEEEWLGFRLPSKLSIY